MQCNVRINTLLDGYCVINLMCTDSLNSQEEHVNREGNREGTKGAGDKSKERQQQLRMLY